MKEKELKIFKELATIDLEFAKHCSNYDIYNNNGHYNVSEWDSYGNSGYEFKSNEKQGGLHILCASNHMFTTVKHFEKFFTKQDIHKAIFDSMEVDGLYKKIDELEKRAKPLWFEFWRFDV